MFDIEGKVALVTGGASGLGLYYAKELLRNGAKGVTLADFNPEFGKKALQEIEEEFGANKALFVKTNVVDYAEFENAFQKTIERFNNLDILINNAGIINEPKYRAVIETNVTGTINGNILGMDKYLPKYRQGPEAVIVNVASVAGIEPYGPTPVYCASKHAVIGMSRCWGVPEFYEETKVRVLAICPGGTTTPMMEDLPNKTLGDRYRRQLESIMNTTQVQEPDFVSTELIRIIKFAPHGTVWVIENAPAYQFVFPDKIGMKKNVLSKNGVLKIDLGSR